MIAAAATPAAPAVAPPKIIAPAPNQVSFGRFEVRLPEGTRRVVFVVGPAYATEPFGRDTRGHLRPGMTVVVWRSSCVGSLAFKHAAGLDLHDESIVVGETSTLPYAARASMHASVRIFHRFDTGFSAAAAPRSNTPRLLEILR